MHKKKNSKNEKLWEIIEGAYGRSSRAIESCKKLEASQRVVVLLNGIPRRSIRITTQCNEK
jgi:hypothetical protein